MRGKITTKRDTLTVYVLEIEMFFSRSSTKFKILKSDCMKT